MGDLFSMLLVMGAALLILHKFNPRDKWGVRTHTKEDEE
jgi:hypothetical protein